MKQEEIENREIQITNDYIDYLNDNPSDFIAFGDRTKDSETMKTRMYFDENVPLNLDKLHIDLLNSYISSGLSQVKKSQFVVSSFSLTPTILMGDEATPLRCILVTYRYKK